MPQANKPTISTQHVMKETFSPPTVALMIRMYINDGWKLERAGTGQIKLVQQAPAGGDMFIISGSAEEMAPLVAIAFEAQAARDDQQPPTR